MSKDLYIINSEFSDNDDSDFENYVPTILDAPKMRFKSINKDLLAELKGFSLSNGFLAKKTNISSESKSLDSSLM